VGDKIPYSASPRSPKGLNTLSESENSEVLADIRNTQFQPITVPSIPAVIEMVDIALRSYFLTHASDPMLINPDAVQEAMKDLKVVKTPRTKGNTEQILEASSSMSGIPPRRDIQRGSRTHHFPTVWEHARVISILNQSKDPALPSSYRPISLLNTFGK
jgi:hypothetical protein